MTYYTLKIACVCLIFACSYSLSHPFSFTILHMYIYSNSLPLPSLTFYVPPPSFARFCDTRISSYYYYHLFHFIAGSIIFSGSLAAESPLQQITYRNWKRIDERKLGHDVSVRPTNCPYRLAGRAEQRQIPPLESFLSSILFKGFRNDCPIKICLLSIIAKLHACAWVEPHTLVNLPIPENLVIT